MAFSKQSVRNLFSDNWGTEGNRIPHPFLSPNQADLNLRQQHTVVTFDIEGTGFIHEKGEMVQLAAVYVDDAKQERTFNRYVMPEGRFTQSAANVTQFSLRQGRLYQCGDVLETVTNEEMLRDFVDWIKEIPGCVLLLGHNCFVYDAPLLSVTLEKHGMFKEFHTAMEGGGFVDTLTMMRDVYPGLKAHSLTALKERVLRKSSHGREAHNALDESKDLHELATKRNVTELNLRQHSKKLHDTYGKYCVTLRENVIKSRAEYDVIQKLSCTVMFYLAGAGYGLQHMRTVAKCLGKRGVQELCGDVLGIGHCEKNVAKIYDYARI